MKLGMCYNVDYHEEIHGDPKSYFSQILDLVDMMEDLGYDSVWFSEHHSGGYSFGNPCVIAAAAAVRTKRIRIGIGVSLLPLHHPLMLAEQYGMLDLISNGRLEFGIGRGYMEKEYEWLGIPMSESHGRYHEAAEFIMQAWKNPLTPMKFDGEYFKVDGYKYFPEPLQKPFPPIYASAGTTRDSFRWAGERGLHLGTPLFLPDRAEIIDNIQFYRKTLVENGYNPASHEVCAITQMYCAKSREEAVKLGGRYATNYYRFFTSLAEQENFFTEARGEELNNDDRVLFGDPEDLVKRIGNLRDVMGIDFLLTEIAQGGCPPDQVKEVLELFGTQVLPHLKKKEAAPA